MAMRLVVDCLAFTGSPSSCADYVRSIISQYWLPGKTASKKWRGHQEKDHSAVWDGQQLWIIARCPVTGSLFAKPSRWMSDRMQGRSSLLWFFSPDPADAYASLVAILYAMQNLHDEDTSWGIGCAVYDEQLR
jgi:hypothetical protein